MAEKPVAIADRLFRQVMAPLVLGGELLPGRPIGGKNAFALAALFEPAPKGVGGTDALDKELLAHVDLGRVRVARRLAPVDRLEPPSAADWELAAVLHDLVQCAHPDLRVRPSSRLLQI